MFFIAATILSGYVKSVKTKKETAEAVSSYIFWFKHPLKDLLYPDPH
jgi:hypothetical protein